MPSRVPWRSTSFIDARSAIAWKPATTRVSLASLPEPATRLPLPKNEKRLLPVSSACAEVDITAVAVAASSSAPMRRRKEV